MKDIDRDRTEYWLREGRETVIVFLHGIGAKDPKDYWQQFLDIVLLPRLVLLSENSG
jgi:predicted esterase